MHAVVWKFELNNTVNYVKMPRFSKPLHVAIQGNTLMLWAWTFPDEEHDLVDCKFVVRATGQPFEVMPNTHYVGTVHDGSFVWHVFKEDVDEGWAEGQSTL